MSFHSSRLLMDLAIVTLIQQNPQVVRHDNVFSATFFYFLCQDVSAIWHTSHSSTHMMQLAYTGAFLPRQYPRTFAQSRFCGIKADSMLFIFPYFLMNSVSSIIMVQTICIHWSKLSITISSAWRLNIRVVTYLVIKGDEGNFLSLDTWNAYY